eukprot:TRINITY_DN10651_c0_g1_i2.p1 TRINITY_DN10651_c0_g1~~TRINITY_DN10651_c0_g1_i2.p1  ORF type:complete len:643 (+),score=263.86 TRINITY_DN10651_c0_g1_i2:65-1993(+)
MLIMWRSWNGPLSVVHVCLAIASWRSLLEVVALHSPIHQDSVDLADDTHHAFFTSRHAARAGGERSGHQGRGSGSLAQTRSTEQQPTGDGGSVDASTPAPAADATGVAAVALGSPLAEVTEPPVDASPGVSADTAAVPDQAGPAGDEAGDDADDDNADKDRAEDSGRKTPLQVLSAAEDLGKKAQARAQQAVFQARNEEAIVTSAVAKAKNADDENKLPSLRKVAAAISKESDAFIDASAAALVKKQAAQTQKAAADQDVTDTRDMVKKAQEEADASRAKVRELEEATKTVQAQLKAMEKKVAAASQAKKQTAKKVEGTKAKMKKASAALDDATRQVRAAVDQAQTSEQRAEDGEAAEEKAETAEVADVQDSISRTLEEGGDNTTLGAAVTDDDLAADGLGDDDGAAGSDDDSEYATSGGSPGIEDIEAQAKALVAQQDRSAQDETAVGAASLLQVKKASQLPAYDPQAAMGDVSDTAAAAFDRADSIVASASALPQASSERSSAAFAAAVSPALQQAAGLQQQQQGGQQSKVEIGDDAAAANAADAKQEAAVKAAESALAEAQGGKDDATKGASITIFNGPNKLDTAVQKKSLFQSTWQQQLAASQKDAPVGDDGSSGSGSLLAGSGDWEKRVEGSGDDKD